MPLTETTNKAPPVGGRAAKMSTRDVVSIRDAVSSLLRETSLDDETRDYILDLCEEVKDGEEEDLEEVLGSFLSSEKDATIFKRLVDMAVGKAPGKTAKLRKLKQAISMTDNTAAEAAEVDVQEAAAGAQQEAEPAAAEELTTASSTPPGKNAFGQVATFKVGDKVWYNSSSQGETKARVTGTACWLDLNVREEADPERVRPRDDPADASDVRMHHPQPLIPLIKTISFLPEELARERKCRQLRYVCCSY